MHACEVYITLTLGAHIRSLELGLKTVMSRLKWVLGKSSIHS